MIAALVLIGAALMMPAVSHEAPAGQANSGGGYLTTWYCLEGRSPCTVGHPASCLCAAASRDLHLRGKRITVSYQGRSVTVRIVDCLCSRSGLDLYAAAFAQLAPLSRGVIRVTISGVAPPP